MSEGAKVLVVVEAVYSRLIGLYWMIRF